MVICSSTDLEDDDDSVTCWCSDASEDTAWDVVDEREILPVDLAAETNCTTASWKLILAWTFCAAGLIT